jgi:DNA-binding transcriptional LysR family regulator
MKITLDSLAVIDAIDRKGSYAAAAEELHKVPSAISYVVQKLEADLDIVIFNRTGHKARLTAAGEVLLQRGRQLLYDARELQARAGRVSSGWESELRIAFDTMIPFDAIVPYVTAFLGEHSRTNLHFSRETLGGVWDALYTRRADLVVGAVGDAPVAGLAVESIGTAEFILCMAPTHPLAQAAEPLTMQHIVKYRGVSIADSSTYLPAKAGCHFPGQETIQVATVQDKLRLLKCGLAIGYLPAPVAQPSISRGELISKATDAKAYAQTFNLSWRPDEAGEGVRWWIEKLNRPDLLQAMWHQFPL